MTVAVGCRMPYAVCPLDSLILDPPCLDLEEEDKPKISPVVFAGLNPEPEGTRLTPTQKCWYWYRCPLLPQAPLQPSASHQPVTSVGHRFPRRYVRFGRKLPWGVHSVAFMFIPSSAPDTASHRSGPNDSICEHSTWETVSASTVPGRARRTPPPVIAGPDC